MDSCVDANGKWFGVDIESESIADNFEKFVWEPALVKVNMLSSATEAACLILSVDETVRNPQSEQPGAGGMPPRGGMRGGRGRGMPRMR
jgi:T-complex protein 1 subunit eta